MCTDIISSEDLSGIIGYYTDFFITNSSGDFISSVPLKDPPYLMNCEFALIDLEDLNSSEEYFILSDGYIDIENDSSEYDLVLEKSKRDNYTQSGLIREIDNLGKKGFLGHSGDYAYIDFVEDYTNCYISIQFAMPDLTFPFIPEEDSLDKNIEIVISIAEKIDENLEGSSLICP